MQEEHSGKGGFSLLPLHSQLTLLSFDPPSLSAKSVVLHSYSVLGKDRHPRWSEKSCLHTCVPSWTPVTAPVHLPGARSEVTETSAQTGLQSTPGSFSTATLSTPALDSQERVQSPNNIKKHKSSQILINPNFSVSCIPLFQNSRVDVVPKNIAKPTNTHKI